MKTLLLVFGMVAAAATAAQAQNYPWCAYYNGTGGARNCGFTTFEQCRANVQGIGGFCQRNTQYQPQKRPRGY